MKGAIKICGIRTADAFECAAREGATHAGFMFVDTSPRFITPTQAAAFARPNSSLVRTAVTLDATDEELSDIHATFAPDLWQLHGSETPARVLELKARFGKPVMKAVTVKGPDSIRLAHAFESVADALLLDAAAGGSGETFDWTLLSSQTWARPWFLAGGLNPETVASAIYQTRPPGVDVSSGVEKSRGNKDIGLIASFISHANKAFDDIARGNAPTHP